MADTYYRLHRADAPTFTADNAWSAAWGETFNEAGDQYECRTCDGTGLDFGEPCPDCDNGWIAADRGYSCCDSAAELLGYFDQHSTANDDDPVVIFEGDYAGSGIDGEPLVVPIRIIRWTSIGQLRTEETA